MRCESFHLSEDNRSIDLSGSSNENPFESLESLVEDVGEELKKY